MKAAARSLSLIAIPAALLLAACEEERDESAALRQHGYSERYVSGYQDGCESGKNAAGDFIHKRRRDEAAYRAGDYRTGWDYGFLTCRDATLRDAQTALLVGSAITAGAAASHAHGADGVNARDALKGVDTSAIKAAGW